MIAELSALQPNADEIQEGLDQTMELPVEESACHGQTVQAQETNIYLREKVIVYIDRFK